MPPIPVNKLTELALSRRKLFEKIMQHVATRKIQNHIQATGDRMRVTPAQFGAQLGKQVGKQAFVTLPVTAGVGAGLGAATSPAGHRMEGLGRGAVKGTGTGVGMIGGGMGGALGALALAAVSPRIGKTLFGPSAAQLADALKRFVQRGGRTITRGGKKIPVRSPGQISPYSDAYLRNAIVRGGTTGAVGGAGLGYAGTSAALGKPSWEKKEASVLSVLGGLAGGGLGGLAGGAGGGILGALGGGALGGGPGAGLGLLAGGAAGLGAGAHMGGNIGSNIGASFSKKKETPESEEKEEKSKEKSEESSDEEVKKSAAVVLAQLQNNAK
jgi:hypothetical protein